MWREVQKEIINSIDSFTLKTLPHSIMLVGEEGAGQEEIVNYISDKFSLSTYHPSQLDTESYTSLKQLTLLVFNYADLSEKDLNSLLKIYEEPPATLYIIVVAPKGPIMETLKNRSYLYELKPYTSAQLSSLVPSSHLWLVDICSTPGQVKQAITYDNLALQDICKKLITLMHKASIPNLLTIVDKINCKEDTTKYPTWLFLKMLKRVTANSDIPLTTKVKLLSLQSSALYYIIYMNDKRKFLEHFLLEFREVVLNGNSTTL